MQYKRLFTAGQIGACHIKNRFVMTAMGCGLAELDGTLGEPLLAYYRERARGGVGMLVTEVTRVNEEHGCMDHRQIRASHDKFIPELRKLADCVHEFDCRVFVQLHHPGNVTYPGMNHGRVPVSASNVPSRIRKQEIHSLTVEEIKELVRGFAEAARRAKEAGIDGVEIHAGHFYLIHQFLSPYFNKRTDEYGGSTENRSRFLLEIIAAIRKICGDGYPVIARLSVEDYLGDEGYHLNEGLKIARLLEEAGVDAIDVTAAGNGGTRSQSLEPTSYQQGWRRHLGAAVKRSVNVPVIAVSVVRDPGFAEELLEKGQTDFVGSGRCYLADTEYVAKIQNQREGEIRRCISCLRCIENIKDELPIVCSVNPDCGAESEQREYMRDGNARKVVVLGAGPAGLEAARVAGERGFDVRLYEKSAKLGGAMYLASKVPYKDKMLWFVDCEQRQCEKLGVHIHRNAELTVDQIKMQQPYAVIDATGAVPVAPCSIPGIDQQIVCTNVDILDGSITPLSFAPTESYMEELIGGREYAIACKSTIEAHRVSLNFQGSRMKLTLDDTQMIQSSNVTYLHGETGYVITPPSSSPILNLPQSTREWLYSAHHQWVTDGILLLTIWYRETGHEQQWAFIFTEDQLELVIANSTKRLFTMWGAKSDRNVDFADMVYHGELILRDYSNGII